MKAGVSIISLSLLIVVTFRLVSDYRRDTP